MATSCAFTPRQTIQGHSLKCNTGAARPSPRRAVSAKAMAEPLLNKPELKRPAEPAPKKLFDEQPTASSSSTATSQPATKLITVEYQRQRAREMTKYFKELKFEEKSVQSKVFGWTPENEVNNGRWVMMGIAIGLLTEYATGVDFINQLKLMVSYLGIVDLE